MRTDWLKMVAAAFLVLLLASACSDESTQDNSDRDESGNIVEGGDVGVFALNVGDCYDQPPSGDVTEVAALPCTEPHDNQVFAVFDIEGDDDAPFPGAAAVTEEAQTTCTGDLFTDFVGLEFASSIYQAQSINPTQETWESDLNDREVICVATSGDGTPLTATVKDTAE